MRLAYLLPLLSSLMLTACSSWEPEPDEIKPVPEDRVLGLQAPVDNGGELLVTRHFAMMGGGCYVAVLVDRQVVARIHVGEQVRFQVPAGPHIVGIGTDEADDTLCGMSRLKREEVVEVEAGGTTALRVVVDNVVGFDIEPER